MSVVLTVVNVVLVLANAVVWYKVGKVKGETWKK